MRDRCILSKCLKPLLSSTSPHPDLMFAVSLSTNDPRFRHSTISVSYTHLDVYKRQVDDITNKLSTKMLFPMLLLMLPSIIMLMLAPMILQLGEFF